MIRNSSKKKNRRNVRFESQNTKTGYNDLKVDDNPRQSIKTRHEYETHQNVSWSCCSSPTSIDLKDETE